MALAVEFGFGLPSPARMLIACGMQRCHQEALKKNRVMLAKQLVLKELMEHMIEKDIITTEMMEMIQVCRLCSTALWACFLVKLSVFLGSGSTIKLICVLPAYFNVITFGEHAKQCGVCLQHVGEL